MSVVNIPCREHTDQLYKTVIEEVLFQSYSAENANRSSAKTDVLHPPIMQSLERGIGHHLPGHTFQFEKGCKLREGQGAQKRRSKKNPVAAAKQKALHSLDVDGRVLDPSGAAKIVMSAKFNFLSVEKNMKNLRRNMKGEIGDIKDIAHEQGHVYHSAYFVNFCNDRDLMFSTVKGQGKVLKSALPFLDKPEFYESNYTGLLLRNVKVLDVLFSFQSDLKEGDNISRLYEIVQTKSFDINHVDTSALTDLFQSFNPQY